MSKHESKGHGTQSVDISFLNAIDTLLLLVDLWSAEAIGANEALALCVRADSA